MNGLACRKHGCGQKKLTVQVIGPQNIGHPDKKQAAFRIEAERRDGRGHCREWCQYVAAGRLIGLHTRVIFYGRAVGRLDATYLIPAHRSHSQFTAGDEFDIVRTFASSGTTCFVQFSVLVLCGGLCFRCVHDLKT